MSQVTLITGDAEGADRVFCEYALAKGHVVFSVAGSSRSNFKKNYEEFANFTDKCYSDAALQAQQGLVDEAAKNLGRNISACQPFKKRILQRNTLQIIKTSMVIAVSDFERNVLKTEEEGLATSAVVSKKLKGVGIEGGTAWACQTFVNEKFLKGKSEGFDGRYLIQLYLFSQKLGIWTQALLDYRTNEIEWRRLEQPPKIPAYGYYTGIGARALTPVGADAIKCLYTS